MLTVLSQDSWCHIQKSKKEFHTKLGLWWGSNCWMDQITECSSCHPEALPPAGEKQSIRSMSSRHHDLANVSMSKCFTKLQSHHYTNLWSQMLHKTFICSHVVSINVGGATYSIIFYHDSDQVFWYTVVLFLKLLLRNGLQTDHSVICTIWYSNTQRRFGASLLMLGRKNLNLNVHITWKAA